MNVVYKLFCRAYQAVFRALIPVLPYRQPQRLERVEQVPEVLKKLSLDRVLLVTDAGLTAPLEAALAASGIACTVYADTRANPTGQNVEDAFALYREHRCNALIALGGGSSMDCAKAVGARAAFPPQNAGPDEGPAAGVEAAAHPHRHPHHGGHRQRDYHHRRHHRQRAEAQIHHEQFHHDPPVRGAGRAADGVAARFLDAVRQLNRRLGIPETLAGIRAEDIPLMARHAAREANPLYPVPVLPDAAQLEAFYTRVAGEQERAA